MHRKVGQQLTTAIKYPKMVQNIFRYALRKWWQLRYYHLSYFIGIVMSKPQQLTDFYVEGEWK